MADERPWDWDWVKAVDTCTAQVMFGRLRTLAEQNVVARNGQLNEPRFKFQEIDGLSFSVNKPSQRDLRANQIIFKVTDDQRGIAVSFGRGLQQPAVLYTVKLNNDGICKLRRDDEDLDPWQVLKSALEPLLFA